MPKSRGRTLSGVAQAFLDEPLLFKPGGAQSIERLRGIDAFPSGEVGFGESG